MKTSIKNKLVLVAMLGTITSYANLMPAPSSSEDIKPIMLTLDNVREGQRLLIKSDNGTILYRESISKTGFYKKEFDLTSLPNGNYFFEFDKDYEIKIIPFEVKGAQVTFNKDESKSIFKPVVNTKDNVVTIDKLALNNEPMEIEIFFDSGAYELIHSEEVSGVQTIQKAYKLLENVTGNYKIVCKTEGRVFVTYFKV
ncbi:MAG: hypothetical protein KJP09_12490 [Bacteroidia bacterium]|nr:hypothetical protein [Bacteroidia bacterium]NND10526.1 hypothetical protein [Flavobacteriaceae bacterium]NNK28082.1 hypothetical protein [Flavobacteriaceae bacterium]RZW38138.1 MAG: hypothetical protein EX263_14195 [Flavobacteriaceae bacterium]